MTPRMVPLLLLGLPLGGCVAGIAANAAGMAIRSAQGEPQSNAHLQPTARSACGDYAARFGAAHIIDVEQRSASRMIVWGTVTSATERRSFQCTFTDRIKGFKLRAIRAPR